MLLKEIFESEFGTSLVFKGGTALRLAYNSPRFSEDLDFTLIRDFDRKEFIVFLRQLAGKYPAITTIEANEKFYTIFSLVRIKEDYINQAFSIKIEVSKREGEWLKDSYEDILIRSEITPLTVLVRVASLERILDEKKDALKNRKAPRDVFDYWYIHQLLKREVKIDLTGFNKEAVRSELHRLLSRSFWRIVDAWLE